MAEQTPMMKQYLHIKAQHKDAFLFFRLGDFYELFFDDAKLAAEELEITLTSRGGAQSSDRIPMCGVPHHSAEQYMSRLIEKGYKIAICEQVEDPKVAKGVVKREVVRILTPGTIMNGANIKEKENNYIVSLSVFTENEYGIARVDLTTGECAVTTVDEKEEAIQEIIRIETRELVVSSDCDEQLIQEIRGRGPVTISYEDEVCRNEEYQYLYAHLEEEQWIETFSRLLNYLVKTQKRALSHLQKVEQYTLQSFMKMDIHTKRNLELTESLRDKKKAGSLLAIIDYTVTAMGGRRLKHWLERPLIQRKQIEQRLMIVDLFIQSYFEREELRDELRHVYDLERLAGKIAYGSVNARELVQLRRSLAKIPLIKQMTEKMLGEKIPNWFEHEDKVDKLVTILTNSFVEDPPISVTEGGMIKDGFNEELDLYKNASKNGKQWIAELERKEREETGIKSLKVGFNRVFGYYIEVTKANLPLLKEGRYERKQTLTNAERFVTPELKEKEALILQAEEKIDSLEYELFVQVRDEVKTFVAFIQQLAQSISEIDVLAGFATVSEKLHYVRPQFSEDRQVKIVNGRHPVVETVIEKGHYVANDVDLHEGRNMLLITGPNMAGKSTYMRQLALLAIMAQIGCYVPAESAELPIFDQMFTRIGAADDLASGQSTFMVEMLETRYALTKATENSLILLDEIGRGTSTYDGMALAQAIIEYIHHEIKAKTLFSTHYHELTALEDQLYQLKNVHVSAIEEDGTVLFLHKVIDGQADRSYGIYVAELAGLPKEVTERAEILLEDLERKNETVVEQVKETNDEVKQLSLFTLEEEVVKEQKDDVKMNSLLKKLMQKDVLHMTPFEALQCLNELQMIVKK